MMHEIKMTPRGEPTRQKTRDSQSKAEQQSNQETLLSPLPLSFQLNPVLTFSNSRNLNDVPRLLSYIFSISRQNENSCQ